MKLNKNMKMSELVESNYHLLGILSRLGIKGSFSDRTVEEVCARYSFDANTFILLCSVYSGRCCSEGRGACAGAGEGREVPAVLQVPPAAGGALRF